ncbi:benzoate-CoA ligase family protein [Comamonas testosteroni]|uniref:Benzoate-CoA ligase family protein n=1 Tax=Comamonas testosteroni TaxID=285 RepID=A0A373FAP3_COMTE|nr:benzoate-CoA ligase family protein [Comamonas testosteroni]RGE41120.1 benzoate-CoA ligase family protein [Comamonas testosteroni]
MSNTVAYSAHTDTFAADNLPPPELQPEFVFELPELQFPERLNCAVELLDRHVEQGRGDRLCIQAEGVRWTYADLQRQANRIANVLTQEMGLVPGNRVLLCAPNNPMMVASWFGVIKAGGIAVAAMPLLRAKELGTIIEIAQVSHALCDAALRVEVQGAQQKASTLKAVRYFNSSDGDSEALEPLMEQAGDAFYAVETAATDTCLLGFTSGTTGVPKATMHFHRDVMAVCACWPQSMLRANADDVFIGSPPMAFTFGLGGQVLFPMSIGASMALLEKASPPLLLDGIEKFGATVVFTAPTSYRVMAQQGDRIRKTRLRKCVSAGEALNASTRALWKDATGIEIIDGIGSTEMLHIFISHREDEARPGATGKAVPGYHAKVVDDDGHEVPVGTVGKLAVKGPTGCRYLNDSRQTKYVSRGWNLTGDAYLMDADGYFVYQARTDDMIISAGYNIAAPEVEEALMAHAAVAECAVIGVADSERGQIVKAFVVLRTGHAVGDDMAKELQDFVKNTVAPYKYPRAVQFVEQLPRTATGKLQRFRLHEQ